MPHAVIDGNRGGFTAFRIGNNRQDAKTVFLHIGGNVAARIARGAAVPPIAFANVRVLTVAVLVVEAASVPDQE